MNDMPVIKDQEVKYNIECLWEETLGHNFHLLLAKRVFRYIYVQFCIIICF